jgi:hypothetical protein
LRIRTTRRRIRDPVLKPTEALSGRTAVEEAAVEVAVEVEVEAEVEVAEVAEVAEAEAQTVVMAAEEEAVAAGETAPARGAPIAATVRPSRSATPAAPRGSTTRRAL